MGDKIWTICTLRSLNKFINLVLCSSYVKSKARVTTISYAPSSLEYQCGDNHLKAICPSFGVVAFLKEAYF